MVTVITLVVFFSTTEGALRLYTRWSILYDVEMSRYANEIKDKAPTRALGMFTGRTARRR